MCIILEARDNLEFSLYLQKGSVTQKKAKMGNVNRIPENKHHKDGKVST